MPDRNPDLAQQLLDGFARVETKQDHADEEIHKLREQVQAMREGFVAQEARVEAFWATGKGAQWDKDIAANTRANKELALELRELRDELRDVRNASQVDRAKAVGLLFSVGALGGAGGELMTLILKAAGS